MVRGRIRLVHNLGPVTQCTQIEVILMNKQTADAIKVMQAFQDGEEWTGEILELPEL